MKSLREALFVMCFVFAVHLRSDVMRTPRSFMVETAGTDSLLMVTVPSISVFCEKLQMSIWHFFPLIFMRLSSDHVSNVEAIVWIFFERARLHLLQATRCRYLGHPHTSSGALQFGRSHLCVPKMRSVQFSSPVAFHTWL